MFPKFIRGKPKKPKRAKAKTAVDKRQDKTIKKIVRDYKPELKFVERSNPANNIPVSRDNQMFLHKLSDIPQGDTDGNRIGNSVLIHYIYLKFVINPVQAAAAESNYLRFMIIQDTGFNGTDPVGADILNDYSVVGQSWFNYQSLYNPNTVSSFKGKRRYRILVDRSVTQNSTSEDVTAKVVTVRKTFKTPINVSYDLANNRANTLFLAVFPGRNTALADNPPFTYLLQLRYSDA